MRFRGFVLFALLLGAALPAPSQVCAQQRVSVTGLTVGGGSGAAVGLQAADGGPAFGEPFPELDPIKASNALNFEIGFYYLRPFAQQRNIALFVPDPANLATTRIEAEGDLSSDFTFAPRLATVYEFHDVGIGVGAGLQSLTLDGSLNRTISLKNQTATLDASQTLNLLSITFLEISKTHALADIVTHEELLEKCRLEEVNVTWKLGTRIVTLEQKYTADLKAADVQSSGTANQDFTGFGISGGLLFDKPVSDSWSSYFSVEGSLLYGKNHRKSTAAASVAGNPALNFNNVLEETESILLPVAEIEIGLLGVYPLVLTHTAIGTEAPALLFFRIGANAQFWGQAGFLDARDNSASFDTEDLVLAGVSFMFGIHR